MSASGALPHPHPQTRVHQQQPASSRAGGSGANRLTPQTDLSAAPQTHSPSPSAPGTGMMPLAPSYYDDADPSHTQHQTGTLDYAHFMQYQQQFQQAQQQQQHGAYGSYAAFDASGAAAAAAAYPEGFGHGAGVEHAQAGHQMHSVSPGAHGQMQTAADGSTFYYDYAQPAHQQQPAHPSHQVVPPTGSFDFIAPHPSQAQQHAHHHQQQHPFQQQQQQQHQHQQFQQQQGVNYDLTPRSDSTSLSGSGFPAATQGQAQAHAQPGTASAASTIAGTPPPIRWTTNDDAGGAAFYTAQQQPPPPPPPQQQQQQQQPQSTLQIHQHQPAQSQQQRMQQPRQQGGRALDWSRSGAGAKRERPGAAASRAAAANRAVSSTSAPANSNSTTAPRKKRKPPSRHDDSDSESDDDDGAYGGANAAPGRGNAGYTMSAFGTTYGTLGLGLGVGMQNRLPGACTHCKKLKMKCEFPAHENVCKRCKAGGHPCIVEGRKPRSAPNKREYLLAQIRQKDAIIESLLKQLHNPYMATPLSIAAYRMASSPSDSQGSRNVIQWLERLQQSVQNQAVGTSEARAFKFEPSRMQTGDGSESETEVHVTVEGAEDNRDDLDTAIGDPEEGKGGGALVQSDSLPPDDVVPIGLLAKLSITNSSKRGRSKTRHSSQGATGSKDGSGKGSLDGFESEDDDNVGVANETYFMPGPATDLGVRKQLIERHSPPEILVHGLVNAEDVENLFKIFYENVNPFLSLLDPELHTPASTFARCPFLFTVVCAISSRYYREKSEVYAIAMHFAKHAAATALIDGWKSVELCQAYILMAVYAQPARRWEEDRSWLYIGLAIRLATDLNLHQASSIKPISETHERELLNRTRVWMICFNLDRSSATQFGKPSTIKEDSIIRSSEDWYKRSKLNFKYDVHLCAYTALLRIVAKFHDTIYSDPNSPSGLDQNLDFRTVTLEHNEKLDEYFEEWTRRFHEDSDPDDNGCQFRCTLLPYLTNYSRLVMFSFGFQQAFKRGFQPGDEIFFDKCKESATIVIKSVINTLAPSGYFRFAPDGHFVFASFASAFLLKLLRPEFSHLVTPEQTSQIFQLIGKLIQVLASSEVSIDDKHTPKLYARFLAGLLAKHQPGGPSSGRLLPRQPPEGSTPESGDAGGPGQIGPGGGAGQNVFHVNSAPQAGSSPHGGATMRSLGHVSHGAGEHGHSHQTQVPSPLSMSSTPMDTPVYEPEATYAIGTGPLELTSADSTQLGLGMGVGYAIQDEEMLATMHAIKNPAFWEDMMMPGFNWPDARTQAYQVNTFPGMNGMPVMQQMPLHI